MTCWSYIHTPTARATVGTGAARAESGIGSAPVRYRVHHAYSRRALCADVMLAGLAAVGA